MCEKNYKICVSIYLFFWTDSFLVKLREIFLSSTNILWACQEIKLKTQHYNFNIAHLGYDHGHKEPWVLYVKK